MATDQELSSGNAAFAGIAAQTDARLSRGNNPYLSIPNDVPKGTPPRPLSRPVTPGSATDKARPNAGDPTKNPLGINSLITFLSANDPALSNRFLVEFFTTSANPNNSYTTTEDMNLSIQCEAASFPGRAFETNIFSRPYGPYRKTPSTALYNDITLTFRCSQSHAEQKYFSEWMNSISSPNTNDYNFYSSYTRNMKVHQLAKGGEATGIKGFYTHTVTLLEAFPVRMDEIPLDANADNSIEKLNVTFAFYRWT